VAFRFCGRFRNRRSASWRVAARAYKAAVDHRAEFRQLIKHSSAMAGLGLLHANP
jgi:hypothetical protein